jgi:DNA-binding MarR family transcriptional regulator
MISVMYSSSMPPQPENIPPRQELARRLGAEHLGYLLTYARLHFFDLLSEALAPLGVESREYVALIYLNEESLSQIELAQLIGVDRTTMVAIVDQLEAKGLVKRHPHPADRRKNLLELTVKGRDIRRRGARRNDEVERQYLSVLSKADARQLKEALRALIDRE